MPKCVTYFLLEPILVSLGPTFFLFFCASQRKGTGGLSAIDLTEQNRTMICLLPTYDAWDTRQVAKLIASKMGSHYLDVLMICFFFYWTKNTPLFRGISRICLLFLGGFRRRKSKMIYRYHGLDKCSMYGICATFTPKITQM